MGNREKEVVFLLNSQEIQTFGWGYQLVISKAQLRVVCRPSFHTLWGMSLSPSLGGVGTLGPKNSPGAEAEKTPDQAKFPKGAWRGASFPSWWAEMWPQNGQGSSFEGALNKLATCPSLSGHRSRIVWDEQTEQRPWSPLRRGLSLWRNESQNIRAWRSQGGYFKAPPVTEEEASQGVNLS